MANAFDYLEGEDDAGRLKRFQNDYHSADRDAVLKDLQGGTLNPSVQSSVTTAPGGGALPPSPAPQVRGAQTPSASAAPAPSATTPGYQVPRVGMPQAPTIQTAPQTSPFDYEQARDSWMSGQYGGGAEGAAKWAQANGVQYDGGDTITLPNGGGQIDIIGNYAGGAGNGQAMRNNWTPAGGNGPNPGGSGQGGVGGFSGSGIGGAGQSSTGLGADLDPTFRAALLQLMQGGERNPNLDAVETSFRNERTRGAQTERAALAERAAFEGLNSGGQGSGAFDTGIQGINENASQDIAGNTGQMEFQDYQARRQNLMQALELANAVGARNEANALQMQLAQMDNSYRYASLNQNQSQWNDRYGLDLADLQERTNRQAYLDAMNG